MLIEIITIHLLNNDKHLQTLEIEEKKGDGKEFSEYKLSHIIATAAGVNCELLSGHIALYAAAAVLLKQNISSQFLRVQKKLFLFSIPSNTIINSIILHVCVCVTKEM